MNLFHLLENYLTKGYNYFEIDTIYYETFNILISFTILILIGWLVDYISKKIILTTVTQLTKKTETVWDDILVEKKVFHRMARLAPAFLFYTTSSFVFYKYPQLIQLIKTISESFMVFFVARTLDGFLNASHSIYELSPYAKQKPIKGYVQVAKIIVYFITTLIILSIVFNKSLVYFFSGLGALAAVLLLVFKDTILGLVASVQLSSNNMVKIGDWITFNKYNADGNVIEISLNTVKVQNFDKTIVTIPTYALISEAFQNWRGMEESEGRRFKRALLFDTRSVRFCNEQFIDKLKSEPILHTFLNQMGEDLKKQTTESSRLIHSTNLGIYRKYTEYILKNHSKLNQDLSLLVRHAVLNENGICLEIISFTRDKAGVPYEQIQAELVEHLLAIASTFELSIFQKPSGDDMRFS